MNGEQKSSILYAGEYICWHMTTPRSRMPRNFGTGKASRRQSKQQKEHVRGFMRKGMDGRV
ncbi:hypothetical protein EBH72_10795 [Klebsiella michiganensis]|nr:hypothetical protein EBH72_10795 [Klebsiella michiganensis]